MQLTFGAGDVFAQMITDASGNAVANATPVRIMGLQEMSVDLQAELKEYYGQNRFALAVAQGKVKVTGKMKGALINGLALNTLFFGSEFATGTMKAIYADVAGKTIPTAAFTIQVTPPSAGTFVEDLGVMGADGVAMVKVAANPAQGQYAVSKTGLYTFAEADKGKTVYPSFVYTYQLKTAKKVDLTNIAMGNTPTFKLSYLTQFKGKKALLELASVTSGKLALFSAKNDDFSVPEVDFTASADEAGFSVGTLWIQE
ncbi:hypothetical protein [Bergeriella denitrificans]|uniref:Phage associated protein n=1 Tax=Bergeriella denitrificans TaxID=494 RepID=A0A378UJ26_BERDE|nr:hypothetical protein [Bergeriella denitrificans]STZ77346.1 phage associated protein [Bergeriella denitrificans]